MAKPQVIDFRPVSDAQANDPAVIDLFLAAQLLSNNPSLNDRLLDDKEFRKAFKPKLKAYKNIFPDLQAFLDAKGGSGVREGFCPSP